MHETIASLLGSAVSNAFTSHLQAYIGLTLEEIPDHLDLFFSSLRGSFGAPGDRVGKYIVRRLYQKAEVQFVEVDGTRLVDYVETLKRTLTARESRGRVT